MSTAVTLPLASPEAFPLHVPAPPRGRPRSGIAELDALDPFPPGRVTLLMAPERQLADLEARLLLDAIERGLDALVVSGDNRLDAYGLLARARTRGLEDAVADGIRLARAFTVHQLAALLDDELPRLAQERPAGIALVPGFLATFLDEDVQPDEARVLMGRVLRRLRAWTPPDLPVVLTTLPALGPRSAPLAAQAAADAGRHVEIVPDAQGFEARLVGGRVARFPWPGSRWQTRIETYGGAR